MGGKRPAEQWYTGDWYRAVDVQKCCPATRGIWRDALDAMVNEQITGKIRGTKEELMRLLRCNAQELQRFFDDNKQHRFADVTFRNGKVTIVCRRLHRAFSQREATKTRVRRHRDSRKRDCNANVTLYSSSSTSLKENSKKKSVTFSFQTGTFEGIADEQKQRWSTAYPAVDIPTAIEQAAAWLAANPAKRKKNYARFLVNWFSREQERGGNTTRTTTKRAKQKLFPIPGKQCSRQGCKLPAVYRDTSGQYDYYACRNHLPPEVKELYE